MSGGLKSHARRHKIARRDGWRCNFCRRMTQCGTCNPAAKIVATMDHIQPRSKGGTEALTNLAIACASCNNAKGNGEWPSPGEKARFSDDYSPVDGYVRGWKRKRLAEPGVSAKDCWRGTRGRRARKAYVTEDAALKVIDQVLYQAGKHLTAFRCDRCGFWHVVVPGNAPDQIRRSS